MRFLPVFLLVSFCAAGEVEYRQGDGRIEVLLGGEEFTTFYYGPKTPKPYLHPVRAHDGAIVTRGFPMETDIPTEAHDHPHHRGLWFTHGDVNGFDFWANETDNRERKHQGKVVLKDGPTIRNGAIEASFSWLSPAGDPVVTETRTMGFGSMGDVRYIDLDATLRAAAATVKFGDTKEGTFAIRVAGTMREQPRGKPGDGVIVNAEGAVGEAATWGKPSPWVGYSGPVDGREYGVAILDHPSNPGHPTHWHVRGYGLFAANIFGEHDYYADPKRDASVTLERGESMRFRYRVLIHPGNAAAAKVGELYKDWAH